MLRCDTIVSNGGSRCQYLRGSSVLFGCCSIIGTGHGGCELDGKSTASEAVFEECTNSGASATASLKSLPASGECTRGWNSYETAFFSEFGILPLSGLAIPRRWEFVSEREMARVPGHRLTWALISAKTRKSSLSSETRTLREVHPETWQARGRKHPLCAEARAHCGRANKHRGRALLWSCLGPSSGPSGPAPFRVRVFRRLDCLERA